MKTYIYHQDPGHGWLEVPLEDLIEYGVRNQISSYSYRDGSTAFLEQDRDMILFVNAYRLRHGCEPVMREQVTSKDSKIRKLRGYY